MWLTVIGETPVVDVHPQTLTGGKYGFWILRLRAERRGWGAPQKCGDEVMQHRGAR
jgi:hypothetical protein